MESKINEIIVRVLSGESSSEEEMRLINWISENEINLQVFSESERIWNAVDIILNRHHFNTEKSFDALMSKVKSGRRVQKQADSLSLKYKFLVATRWVAIIIFLLCLGGLIGYIGLQNFRSDAAFCEVDVPKGARSNIKLPDGTIVWLNAESNLKYSRDFGVKNRKINLIGEGYFEVAKNAGKPFIVEASGVEIVALGTVFNVKSYPDDNVIQATLIEGMIMVHRESDLKRASSIVLEPNQQLTYYKKTGEMTKGMITEEKTFKTLKTPEDATIKEKEGKVIISKKVNTSIVTAWKDNHLAFENETFEKIAIKLERRFAVNIIFKDEEVMNYRFSGRFDNISIEQALAALKFASPFFSYSIEKDTIYITPK